jgi:hypothetical protein
MLSVAVAVAAAANASKSLAASARTETTTSPTAAAKPAMLPIGYEQHARTWIRKHASGADNVAANLSIVQLALGQLRRSPTQASINQLAAIAQTARNGLEIGSDFDDSDTGTLGTGERQVVLGAHGLQNAMKAIVAYADSPTRARLARMTLQYQTAVTEWNDGVRTIWHVAHSPGPPII